MFSLFSSDVYAPEDPPLICQLVCRSGKEPQEYVNSEIVLPVVRAYFATIRDLGLQPEWNAQNLLLGTTRECEAQAFVMRDLESVDKDLTLRTGAKLTCSFESAPHKCIDKTQYNYKIKHSFMFDYKLCGYIIEPILKLVASVYGLPYETLVAPVRDEVDHCLQGLPADFFPEDGFWYAFESVLIDQSGPGRPYVKYANPAFRSSQ